MKGKPNRRHWKNMMIRKDVQLPIIAANLALLVVVVGILVAVLLSPFYIDMLDAEKLWVRNISGHLFLTLLQRIALAMFLILVAAMVHQIVLSHRIFGPLVNFNHTFELMACGNYSRKVYLRKNDFLKGEAEQINRVIDRLNGERACLAEQFDQIAAIQALLVQNDVSPASAALIGKLEQAVEICRGIVFAGTPDDPDGGIQQALLPSRE